MRSNRSTRLLIGAAAAASATLTLGPIAEARQPEPSAQSEIDVPDGNQVFLAAHGVGVQIYSCDAAAGDFDWAFVAPRADLFDRNGRLVIDHFAGPTWQANDGSAVVGAVEAKITVDETAIPWLRLSATPAPDNREGGRLSRTTFIQRTETVGGLAPEDDECNAETLGTVAEVPYTADYIFWKRVGR